MQSRLIQVGPRSARKSLALLTLCAIAVAPAPAWAQSAPPHVTALPDSTAPTDGDERSATDAMEDSRDRANGQGSGDAPVRFASVAFGAPGMPLVAGAPFAFMQPAAQGPLALTLPKIPLQTTDAAEAPPAAAPTTVPAPVAMPATPASPPAPDVDDGSGLRTAGFVAGGVGLAGLVLFAVAGLAAKSAYDRLDTDCGNTPCTDQAHQSDIEAGRMWQTTANIGLAAGLTGLGVGATLLVLGNRSPAEKPGPSASVSTNGGMITYGGSF